MEWSTEKTLALINLYKSYPPLWDCRLPTFKNRILKGKAWFEIGKRLKVDRHEVARKMRNLIGQFDREKRKSTTGAEPQWFAYESLQFLRDRSNLRKKKFKVKIPKHDIDISHCLKSDSHEVANEVLSDENSERPPNSPHTSTHHTLKRARNNVCYERTDTALQIMQATMQLKSERDEYSVFGENVAFKVRKLSNNYAKSTVQHLINNILYEGELGKYDKPPEEIF